MSKFKAGNDGYIRNLEGVAVGDEFMIWEGRWDSKLVKVTCSRVTPKQCQIGSNKYRIADARGLGGDSWHFVPSLMPVDERELEKDREKHEVNAMRSKLGGLNWKNVDDGPVRAIYNIVWGVSPTKG